MRSLVDSFLTDNNQKATEVISRALAYLEERYGNLKSQSGSPVLDKAREVGLSTYKTSGDSITAVAGTLACFLDYVDLDIELISKHFGEEIGDLITSIKMLDDFTADLSTSKSEKYRKMLIYLSKDIRVLLIKICIRLSSIRMIKHYPEEHRAKLASESLDIYAPLAHRMSLNWIKWEMEDFAFKGILPDEYFNIAKFLSHNRVEREEFVEKVIQEVKDSFESIGLKSDLFGRPKHIYSIYKKSIKKNIQLSDMYDLYAIRVLVDTKADCYTALGLIHNLYPPLSTERVKDYIASPKPNLYQSLHTTVTISENTNVEFQVRTHEMNNVAEGGIASHVKYKENIRGLDDKEVTWLSTLIEKYRNRESEELIDKIKNHDIIDDNVYAFTPKGDVVELRRGSIVLDFAYSIHSEVGHRCIGGKVGGKVVPIRYQIKNGDRIEILTSSSQRPKKEWLHLVDSNRSKNKIRQYFNKLYYDNYVKIGTSLLNEYLQEHDSNVEKIRKHRDIKQAVQKLGANEIDDMLYLIGKGDVNITKVINTLYPTQQKFTTKVKKGEFVPKLSVGGVEGIYTKRAKCCNPLPGDKVVGYISIGRGVIIHKLECGNTKRMQPYRMVDVDWSEKPEVHHYVLKLLTTGDQKIVNAINTAIIDHGASLLQLESHKRKDGKSSVNVSIEAFKGFDINRLLYQFNSTEGVEHVEQKSYSSS